jgi:phosphohistidine phosphatase SixA
MHIRNFKFKLWPKILCQFIFVISVLLIPFAAYSSGEEDPSLWNAIRSPGHIALVRHATAPGTGDPTEFELDDCRTQRNLSEEGRNQAKRIGARFRVNGMARVRIYSSQWCRCWETAGLFDLGTVKTLPILNSFFQRFMDRERQTKDLAEWLARQSLNEPLLLVTHQVNITALTNVYPSSGEIVIIHRSNKGKISVVGSINTN